MVFLDFIAEGQNDYARSSIRSKMNIRIFFGGLVAVGLLTTSFPAAANAAGVDFYSQCPIMLARADGFAQTCRANAKPWGREFNGQPEMHVADLGTPAPGSHFALGCTLNAQQEIAFLGVYYTIHPDNFGRFQSSPLTYVDYNGDIGILVNGELVNFIAVRPLMPGSISLPRFSNGIKNCDPLPAPTSSLTYSNGDVEHFLGPMVQLSDVYGIIGSYVKVWNVGAKVIIRYCGAPGACEPDTQYLPLFGRDRPQLLVTLATPDEPELFIENNGNLLMKSDVLQSSCPVYYAAKATKKPLPLDSENMVREVCLSPEYRAISR
jgi:hypothetical protein